MGRIVRGCTVLWLAGLLVAGCGKTADPKRDKALIDAVESGAGRAGSRSARCSTGTPS